MNSLVTHSNQLAGHADHLFKDADGKVLKRTNKSESNFYESLKSRNISELIMNFFPKFYGSKVYDGDSMYNFNYCDFYLIKLLECFIRLCCT